MVNEVKLPQDETVHSNQAIEWWYFNGFLFDENERSKKPRHAFMTCLFKADKDKVNLRFLKVPFKNVYFSHSLIYDLKEKTVEKEILPFVIPSEDSFKKEQMFINYFFPLRRNYINYEILRNDDHLTIKTADLDLKAIEIKKPLLENDTGYINLGEKSTYYYTYPNLAIKGTLKDKKVHGFAWHDHQWSEKGFMKDSWLWFSIQLEDNTQIVCFDYKGKKMATISYPNNKQETVDVTFTPQKKTYKIRSSGMTYELSWIIKIKDFVIKTKPIIEDCEMTFGFLNYWEGPLEVTCKGKKGYAFMEHLAKQELKTNLLSKLKAEQTMMVNSLKDYFSKF